MFSQSIIGSVNRAALSLDQGVATRMIRFRGGNRWKSADGLEDEIRCDEVAASEEGTDGGHEVEVFEGGSVGGGVVHGGDFVV